MTCTFSASGLTSIVSGQQPTFSYSTAGHTGDYFAVQMVYTSLPGVLCYGGAPPFTPVLVNSAQGYTQSCSFVYSAVPLYTGIYCPNAAVTAIPSGDLVISYKGLSSGLFGTSPAPIPYTARFSTSPAAVIVTTTVGTTTTSTSTSTAPGGFAATSTVYVPLTTSTSTSTVSSTNTVTSTNTFTVSSCSAKSSSASSSSSSSPAAVSSSPPAASSSSSPAATSSSSPAATSSSSPAATSSSSSAAASSSSHAATSSSSSAAASSSSPAAASSSSPAAASSSSPVATSSSSSSPAAASSSSPAAATSSSAASSTSSSATSSSASPSASLSCPANDGQTFSTSQGNFVVECYYDRYDSDVGTASPQPSNFAQCIQACASYSGCVDVSYVPGGPCYLKSTAGTPNSNGNVWGARLATASGPALPSSSASSSAASAASSTTSSAAPSSTVACPASDGQIINTSAGQFQIECGVDRNDHDMSGSPVYPSTYEACLNACASTSGCVDVSYVPGGACYLKNGVGAANSNSNIIGGRLLVNGQSASSKVSATSTSTSSVATSSTTSYSTITVTSTISSTAYQCACTPTAALSSNSGSTLSCPASDGQTYTSECGATYAIECSADRYGNDLPNGNVQASSLNACLKACDKTSGCVDVSWVVGSPGTCYMKGSVGAIRQNSNIWGGRLLSSCTSTAKLQLKLHRKRVAKHDEKVNLAKRGKAIGPDFTFISTTTTATATSTYTLAQSTTTTALPAGTSMVTINTTAFTTTTMTLPVATTTTATTTVTTCPAGPFRQW